MTLKQRCHVSFSEHSVVTLSVKEIKTIFASAFFYTEVQKACTELCSEYLMFDVLRPISRGATLM